VAEARLGMSQMRGASFSLTWIEPNQ